MGLSGARSTDLSFSRNSTATSRPLPSIDVSSFPRCSAPARAARSGQDQDHRASARDSADRRNVGDHHRAVSRGNRVRERIVFEPLASSPRNLQRAYATGGLYVGRGAPPKPECLDRRRGARQASGFRSAASWSDAGHDVRSATRGAEMIVNDSCPSGSIRNFAVVHRTL